LTGIVIDASVALGWCFGLDSVSLSIRYALAFCFALTFAHRSF
jgi:hypothetical protein